MSWPLQHFYSTWKLKSAIDPRPSVGFHALMTFFDVKTFLHHLHIIRQWYWPSYGRYYCFLIFLAKKLQKMTEKQKSAINHQPSVWFYALMTFFDVKTIFTSFAHYRAVVLACLWPLLLFFNFFGQKTAKKYPKSRKVP